MRHVVRPFAVVAALGLVGACAQTGSAALAQQQGGSGYSGQLSKNKVIRKQQLICDPATTGPTNGGGAPIDGYTSVTYDPGLVTLSGFTSGPGYAASAEVAVLYAGGEYPGYGGPTLSSATTLPGYEGTVIFQPLGAFLESPYGPEVGYVRVGYEASGAGQGQMSPDPGYTVIDADGVAGFDTHSLFFTYLSTTPDSAVSTYQIFAREAGEFWSNDADYLAYLNAKGERVVLGPDQLISATVRGSLNDGPHSVPLPPAGWAGLATMGGAGLLAARRRMIAGA